MHIRGTKKLFNDNYNDDDEDDDDDYFFYSTHYINSVHLKELTTNVNVEQKLAIKNDVSISLRSF